MVFYIRITQLIHWVESIILKESACTTRFIIVWYCLPKVSKVIGFLSIPGIYKIEITAGPGCIEPGISIKITNDDGTECLTGIQDLNRETNLTWTAGDGRLSDCENTTINGTECLTGIQDLNRGTNLTWPAGDGRLSDCENTTINENSIVYVQSNSSDNFCPKMISIFSFGGASYETNLINDKGNNKQRHISKKTGN